MPANYLNINVKVDGETLSLSVDRDSDEEVAYREAAKILESSLIEFRNRYGASRFSKETQLKYMALTLLKENFLRERENDIFLESFDKLEQDLSSAIESK
ncbi:MAG: cell division protein ZapA [Paludibacteraceae bacterium]|nr:cell division protein ZapA [Paludibacteraceae bacterium]